MLVAGAGVAGAACARVLLGLGRRGDRGRPGPRALTRRARRRPGADGRASATSRPPTCSPAVDEVVVSPGLRAAHAAGAGRVGRRAARLLASRSWPGGCAARTRRPGSRSPAPTARPPPPRCSPRSCARPGLRTAALGNIGEPLVDAVLQPDRFDVLAVELSSFQLHWSSTLAPQAGALLNLADDHLDWHGTFDAYAEAKTAIWRAAGAGTGSRSATSTTPRVAARSRARAGAPGRGHPGRAERRAARGGRRHAGRPRLRRRAGRRWPRRPASGRPAPHNVEQRPARRGPGPRVRCRRRPRSPPGWPATCPSRTATRWSPRSAGWPTSTTARRPTRTPRPPRCIAYPRIVWVAGGQLKGVDIDDLVARGRRPAGRRGAARRRPGADRRRAARDTRPTSRSWRWRGRMMARWPRW